MEQHRTLTLDGHTVHYRDEGRQNKQTLVLLHGFLQNLDVWSSYVLSYMHHLHVVTIDLPGHGLTDCFSDTHTPDMMATVVKAVLDECGVEQCVVAGHSLGGYVALAFAENYSYMLRGVALINSHAMADNADIRARREAVCIEAAENRANYILGFVPSLFDDNHREALAREIKELNDQCLETSTEAIVAAQRGMAARPSRIALLQQIDVPVYFIFGRNDNRLPIELAVTQTLLPRRCECLTLDGVGHMAFIEAREYIKPRLMSFVDNCYYQP